MRRAGGGRSAIGGAFALVAALSGCSSWNPLVAVGIVSEPANKPVALAPIKASLSPRLAWQQPVGKAEGFVFRPAIFERRVYAVGADGQVSIVDEDTGRPMLKVDLKKKLSGGVEIGDGKAIVGTLKGEVIASDAAGKVLWTSAVADEVVAPAAVARNRDGVRTSDGRILRVNRHRWEPH